MEVPAERIDSERGTLEYAPVHPGRKIRWSRWLVSIFIVGFVSWWSYRYLPTVLENVRLDLEIRRCMNVTLPSDGVALDATFWLNGQIVKRAALDVPEMAALRKLRGGITPDAYIFVGRMTTRSGVRKLVALQVLHNTPFEPMMIITRTITPASWPILSDAQFSANSYVIPSLNPTAYSLDVLAGVGLVDASDAAHLSFTVKVNGRLRCFDFWLGDAQNGDTLEERVGQSP